MNKIIVIGVLGLMLVGCANAISADYFYHPQCSHCNNIKSFMSSLSKIYKINWVDTSIPKSYPIDGTPTLIIHASDGRSVLLVGSYEIPKYALCELKEQSSLECMTYPYLNCSTNSYFVRS